MGRVTSFGDEVAISFDTVRANFAQLFDPAIRLGVTGLSRAGKTVFITSLVHNLLHGGRLALFDVVSERRMTDAQLRPQPDDGVPRFQYEEHLRALVEERVWPVSTRAISQLRLTVRFESASGWTRRFGAGQLSIDIVDYPGEWLLDLPLLGKDYDTWAEETVTLSREPGRAALAAGWHAILDAHDPDAQATDVAAQRHHAAFADYLTRCREDAAALSTLPPGRFLMPGDMEGSPALTFAPVPGAPGEPLRDMMERRYEAYKRLVVKPFFRDHFARLDRQIVLVDALQAMNAGGPAVADLEGALADILGCFNPGRRAFLASLFTVKTDRILFAATKADHLHHENHDRLERILARLVDRARKSAEFAGAQVDAIALAALRATREGTVEHDGEELPVIVGTPLAGEVVDGRTFDGETRTAVFPGDLPKDPAAVLDRDLKPGDLRFVRFRPPRIERSAEGLELSLPHIRLDRALQFLLGDRLA